MSNGYRTMKELRSSLYPVGHLLNPATPYTPSNATNVRATWARAKPQANVVKMKARRKD